MKIIIIALIPALVLTPLVLYIIRCIQSSRMRRKIASEGFETATEILYPSKRRMFRKYKIGPVFPR